MTRRAARFIVPSGPHHPPDPLATIGVALMVVHYCVLAHRDAYGGCPECLALVDEVAPELSRLQVRSSRAARWNEDVMEETQPDLLDRLMGRLGWPGAQLAVADDAGPQFLGLPGTDVELMIAAFGGGRHLTAKQAAGGLSDFVHVPGRNGHRGLEPCDPCTRAAEASLRTLDKRTNPDSPEDSKPRPSRLGLIATVTRTRLGISRLFIDGIRKARSDGGGKARPDKLPMAFTVALRQYPDLAWPAKVYLQLAAALTWWVGFAEPVLGSVPWENIGAQVKIPIDPEDPPARPPHLTGDEAQDAYAVLEAACAEHPTARERLRANIGWHLERIQGGESMHTEEGPVRIDVDRTGAGEADTPTMLGSSNAACTEGEVVPAVTHHLRHRLGATVPSRAQVEDATIAEMRDRMSSTRVGDASDIADATIADRPEFADIVDEVIERYCSLYGQVG